jgi:hypothetical protein
MNQRGLNTEFPEFGSMQPMAARSEVVNRVHRIVREQAIEMREQKARSRSLLAPIATCSVLLLIFCYSIWYTFDAYDATPTGVPDASDQLTVFLAWSLPVTAVALALVWFRRNRNRANGEV